MTEGVAWEMTEARDILHKEILPAFLNYVKREDIVYEIGKGEFDYHAWRSNIITLDRDVSKHPDLVVDVEATNNSVELRCDALMCIGVLEECDNPFHLIEGVRRMLKDGGVVVFGIALIGNEPYKNDFWRFTINGARKLIGKFEALEEKIIYTKEVPSYAFIIARNVK